MLLSKQTTNQTTKQKLKIFKSMSHINIRLWGKNIVKNGYTEFATWQVLKNENSICSSFHLGFWLTDTPFAIWGLMSLEKTANKAKKKLHFPFPFLSPNVPSPPHIHFPFHASNSHAQGWDFPFFVLFYLKLIVYVPQLY